jgi:hypothetical protein
MKSITVCIIAGLSLAPLCASAQQSTAGGNASDIKYCGQLARAYQSMYSAQEGMPVSDVVMLGQCDTDPRGTIATLRKKLADKKIDVPQEAGVAQQPGSTQ